MAETKYDNMQMIVNWDRNPEKEKGARQIIYSTASRDLPNGDYNIYIGKVIDKISINAQNNIVFSLRLPKEDDLSPGNLSRRPLSKPLEQQSVTPTSIMKPNQAELMQLKQDMVQAEREYKESQ